MSAFEIYLLWTVIPGLQELGIAVAIVAGIAAAGGVGCHYDSNIKDSPRFLRISKFAAVMTILGVLTAIFVPNREDIAVIVAGAYGTSIGGIDALPQEMVDAARTALQRYIEEAKP